MKKSIVVFSIVVGLMLGVSGASTEDHDSWQQPEKVMDVIGVKPGMTISEVGAGYELVRTETFLSRDNIYIYHVEKAALAQSIHGEGRVF